jgi:hypothetical protein
MKPFSRDKELKKQLKDRFLGRQILEKDINELVKLINVYEKNNIDTIEKLNRNRIIEMNRITGGLRQTIFAHGPITKQFIGSASKRIWGNLLENKPKKQSFLSKLISWIKK